MPAMYLPAASIYQEIPAETISPGSVGVSWNQGGAKSASDAGDATLNGDASGVIVYSRKAVELQFSALPDKGAQIDFMWNEIIDGGGRLGTPTNNISATPDSTGLISENVGDTGLVQGSVSISWNVTRKNIFIGSSNWNPQGYTYEGEVAQPRTAIDDGSGNLLGADGSTIGSINYSTGSFTLTVEADYDFDAINTPPGHAPGIWAGDDPDLVSTVERENLVGNVNVVFETTSTTSAESKAVFFDKFSFLASTTDPRWQMVPGSLVFTFSGKKHFDIDGIIYTNFSPVTGAGNAVGTIDYKTKLVTLTDWPNSSPSMITINSLLLERGDRTTTTLVWRAPGRPLRPSSVQITATRRDTGAIITATSDVTGAIDTAEMEGQVDYETGIIRVRFWDGVATDIPVWLGSIRYNAVIQSFLPLDTSLVGINPVRLPSDGRVPIFRDGEVVVMQHTKETDIGTPTDGQVFNLTRDKLAKAHIEDVNGTRLKSTEYSVNLSTGVITLANPVSLVDENDDALTTPLAIFDTIEHMSVITDTQISGALSLLAPVAHDYPAEETLVSSALLWGDRRARAFNEFDQKTWQSDFLDELVGDAASSSYNLTDSPILVTNDGAISQRWAIVFTSSTTFQVIGETVGFIATGSTATNTSPMNTVRAAPYFTIYAAGWGSGWSEGNVLRFNTVGANAQLWLGRTVIAGEATANDDNWKVAIRGDSD